MSTPEDLIRYLLLEHVSALDFISTELVPIKGSEELRRVGYVIIPRSVARFGYLTELRYDSIAKEVWPELSCSGIFEISADSLFGERVNFNIDLYRQTAEDLKAKSKSYGLIKGMIDQFGSSGFRRAISAVADDHKWRRIQIEGQDEADGGARQPVGAKSAALCQFEVAKLSEEILSINASVDKSALSQADKSQAYALVSAAHAIIESPNPPWAILREILYMIAAISTVLGFVALIAEKIA